MCYQQRATMIYRDGFIGGDYEIAAWWFQKETPSEDILDDMWRWTQNIFDSWSRPGCRDNHPDMNVLRDLEVVNGQQLGFRSSMVGDVIQIEMFDDIGQLESTTSWVVEPIGFRELTAEEAEEIQKHLVVG